MNKKLNFEERKESRIDEKIEKTLNAEFEVPKLVEMAKQEAFMQVRRKAAQDKNASTENIQKKNNASTGKERKRFRAAYRVIAGAAAAAAVFSGVCITNPAFAANVPVVGSVFEQIGKSLGFSGDYSEYAKPLADEGTEAQESTDTENAKTQGENETQENQESMVSENGTASGDNAYSKTVNGVTVTLSEVYCNEVAMYLSMSIKSEEPFPETVTDQEGAPVLLTDADLTYDFNPGYRFMNGYLDGKLLDEHTYAGVLRMEMREASFNYEGMDKFYEEREAFLKEKGLDMEKLDFSQTTLDEIAEALGMESYSDENFAAVGGPDITEYNQPIEIPEKFNVDFNIHKIIGTLPEEKQTIPEMPQELKDEYNKAMAENGLDESNYENFTEEEKEIEHKLFTEMYNKYAELYPETRKSPNSYENWVFEGDWDFQFDVEMDHTRNVTKEVNLLDENGNGILSVTKTPFEMNVEVKDSNAEYVAAVLDADGDLMPYGGSGNADTYAIKDRDVSKVYLYLCDYYEYMDELKGYYWSPDYEEKKKTKNFKQYLDEKGIPSAVVEFEQ